MVKTLLIPIDFTVSSLNTLKLALEQEKAESVEIILLYAELQSDSITDLLFYSADKIVSPKLSSDFVLALEAIRNRFEKQVTEVAIKVFHGINIQALNSFLVVNCVDEIFIPKTYKLTTPGRAFDPIPLLRKSSFPVYEMAFTPAVNAESASQLDALFHWVKQ